ncbi:hypothetical protein [Actinomadura violacea]|uniref:ANTAR domain-containing protein n=1 Tax=Actinomadura violacea TaxID=2819934 RepID=A0ABS3RII0_9ACTN|nr:hypothetical protein [Actinomadura violacea]MBO2456540.1 hypothetical protein [Actinomadura violacea]
MAHEPTERSTTADRVRALAVRTGAIENQMRGVGLDGVAEIARASRVSLDEAAEVADMGHEDQASRAACTAVKRLNVALRVAQGAGR